MNRKMYLPRIIDSKIDPSSVVSTMKIPECPLT